MIELFWTMHDPYSPMPTQYMSAIFPVDKEQEAVAIKAKGALEKSSRKKVWTDVTLLSETAFYQAEDYHQKYYLQKIGKGLKLLDFPSTQAMIDSFVACRLNGYVAGHGTVEQLNRDVIHFKLPKELEKSVRERHQMHHISCRS